MRASFCILDFRTVGPTHDPYTLSIMEAGYTCLRCVRALTKTAGRSSKRMRTATQSFSTSSRSSHAASKPPSASLTGTAFKQSARLASTAAARVDEQENDRRRNAPNVYGEYRAPLLLRPDNLFHPFSSSPVLEIRGRAHFIKRHAYCPHPIHQSTRAATSPNDPEARKVGTSASAPPAHVQFECPDCGIATYCCEEHWMEDYEKHLEVCDVLRQINEDDHDLRSGRWFHEFEYPEGQYEEILPNMTNWDTFLYTRQFEAINEDRSMRQATRLLTYPLTVGSILHELSPYNIRAGNRLTIEGLKSFSGKSDLTIWDATLIHLLSSSLYLTSSSIWCWYQYHRTATV